jgi:hypothetical protein
MGEKLGGVQPNLLMVKGFDLLWEGCDRATSTPGTESAAQSAALLILGMNWGLYELKLRSNSYCYSAPPNLPQV